MIAEKLQGISGLTDAEVFEMTEKYCAHNYHPMPLNVVHAEGVYVYDAAGKDYIDCISGYSAVSNGHLAPAIVNAMKKQLDVLTLTARAVYTPELAILAKTLCEFAEMDKYCPMNTGAEAVETAIKIARKWAYKVKDVPEGQAEIIVAAENFHGRTITIIGFSTEAQFQDGFGPFTPGFKIVPFGDIEAIKAAITPNTAAVLMEPMQAEGGMILPPPGWMADVRELCSANNVLLAWDEVQTGFGRTGAKFAWMHEGAKPDLMCVGKALGGGVYPVSGVLGSNEVISVLQPGDHGSTFGGNPLGAAVATAAIEDMRENDLHGNSAKLGLVLAEMLESINHPLVEAVRGQGLLIGMQLKAGVNCQAAWDAFLQAGVVTKETIPGVFRFTPPLTITKEQVQELVLRVKAALDCVQQAVSS